VIVGDTLVMPAGKFDPAEWGTAYRDQAIEIIVRRASAYGTLAAPH